jgi:molybdopterin converting factor small subunit
MEIKVQYFGQLTEIVGKREEVLVLQDNTVMSLYHLLLKTYPFLKDRSFQFAQSNQIIGKEAILEAATVDVFPPFSGG